MKPEAAPQSVLAIDIGGTNVKVLASGQDRPRRIASGPKLTPNTMVALVKELVADWEFDVIAVGYPGRVVDGRIVGDPRHLATGWVGFDFARAFDCPVRIVNDATLQALGSYRGGTMLFLGLVTGLGSALVANGMVVPLEFGQLPFRRSTYEGYLGKPGLKRFGKRRWRHVVNVAFRQLTAAIQVDDVVIGGGNVELLDHLPAPWRRGNNDLAFVGGFRLWGVESASLRINR